MNSDGPKEGAYDNDNFRKRNSQILRCEQKGGGKKGQCKVLEGREKKERLGK